jgi:hypothetical protein
MPAIPRQRRGGRKLEIEQFATGHAPQIVWSGRCVGNLRESNFRRGSRFALRLGTGRLFGPGGPIDPKPRPLPLRDPTSWIHKQFTSASGHVGDMPAVS